MTHPGATAPPSPRRPPARAITFLEIVFASALLGVAAAAITSAYAAITRFAERQRVTLEAHEVAHRLILQYLDDPEALNPDTDVFPLGRGAYRYLINEQTLTPKDVEGDNITVRGAQQAAALNWMDKLQARLQLVTVEVYEAEDFKTGLPPVATLSRIYDPLEGAEDDPDAFGRLIIRLFKDDPMMQDLLRNAIQQQSPPGAAPPSQGSNAPTSPPSSSPRRITPGGGSNR